MQVPGTLLAVTAGLLREESPGAVYLPGEHSQKNEMCFLPRDGQAVLFQVHAVLWSLQIHTESRPWV